LENIMAQIQLSEGQDTKEDFDKVVSALWGEAVARDWQSDFRNIMREAGATKYITSKCQLSGSIKFRVHASMMGTISTAMDSMFGPVGFETVMRHVAFDRPPQEGAEEGACVCPENESQAITWIKDWVNAKFRDHQWGTHDIAVTRVDVVTGVAYQCDSEDCPN
jgi:hypothetical protein